MIYVAASRHSPAHMALQSASMLGSSVLHGVWHKSPQGPGSCPETLSHVCAVSVDLD